KWEHDKFYASESIDLGARATHQLFESAFEAGGPMQASFPLAFVSAMRTGLGPKLDTAAAYLSTMASINLDARDKDRKRKMRRTLRGTAAWEYGAEDGEGFVARAKQFPAMSVATLLRADQLGQIDGLREALTISAQALKQALGSSG